MIAKNSFLTACIRYIRDFRTAETYALHLKAPGSTAADATTTTAEFEVYVARGVCCCLLKFRERI